MTRVVRLMLSVLALSFVVVPASADTAFDDALTITGVTPEQWTDDADLTLTGTVDTAQLPDGAELQLRLSAPTEPILTPGDVEASLSLDAATTVTTAAVALDSSSSGSQSTFTLTASAGELAVRSDEVASVVDVELIDATDQTILGKQRAFIPHASAPRTLADVVVLTATPTRLPGTFAVAPQTADIIAALLTELQARPSATIIVDPLLYNDATLLARTDATAAAFVAAVDQALTEDQVWVLPHGNPALTRLPETIQEVLAEWVTATTPSELADAPTVALSTQGTAVPGFDQTIVLAPGPGPRYAQLLTSDAKSRPLAGLSANVPGTQPEPTAQWADVDETVAEIQDAVASQGELLEAIDPAQIQSLLLTSYSTQFAAEQDALDYLERAPITTFDPAEIQLSVSSSFVMTQRDSRFPATISNATGVQVRVRLALESDNPQRIDVADTDVVEIAAGESQTVLISPTANSNGATILHARLATPDGAPLGPSAEVEVTATSFGRVGWIIIIASGAFVLAGTAWRIRAVRHEQAKESSESGQ